MGLLIDADVLPWEEILAERDNIKHHGISQFALKYKKYRKSTFGMYWGDEIELMACRKERHYVLVLCSKEAIRRCRSQDMSLSVEYARYMLETMPRRPFDMSLSSFEELEQRLEARRRQLASLLDGTVPGTFPLFTTCFPDIKPEYFSRNGETNDQHEYTSGEAAMAGAAHTRFPAFAITDHPRFVFFTKNIVKRRGKEIEGYVKIMRDANTRETYNIERDAILVDSMGQGMGCCCLQVTVQYTDLDQARYQYDALGVVAPLMLRMSRATPVSCGYLLNTETRWDMVTFSVDSRTDAERARRYNRSGYESDETVMASAPIKKSRFSSIDMFISLDERNLQGYNDTEVPEVAVLTEKLLSYGVDALMSRHISSLFVRDPIIAYEAPKEETYEDINEFENIQSTNWRSVRLKVPFKEGNWVNGWRVEFRTLEVQPTSFENTAFTIFVVLLSMTIIHYDVNLYLPMSLVEHNFFQSSRLERKPEDFSSKLCPDAVLFYYRTNLFDRGPPIVEKGTLDDIFNGKDGYVGLASIVRRYISEVLGSAGMDRYLDFIEGRCRGSYVAVSEYIRRFVLNHSMYRHDSVVSREIASDLVEKIREIEEANDPSYLENR